MIRDTISRTIVLILFGAVSVLAQENGSPVNWPPRILFDADIGTRGELGFIPPSSDFGIAFEWPIWKRLEIQGSGSFSPDRKQITQDGHSIDISETQILWVSTRFGLSAEVDYHSLWTSQFLKKGWHPYPGFVARTRYFSPGRFYASMAIPTGCVWATPTNPCRLQSNRTVGPIFMQEWQARPRIRIALQGEVLHFCDQSNENEPQIPRICHWAGTEMFVVRFQFPPWKSNENY